MDYERIHKVQTGIISPGKLRIKLMGSSHQQMINEGANCNSSRTSPSRLEEAELARNSLLTAQNGDFDVPSSEIPAESSSRSWASDAGQGERNSSLPKDLIPKENDDVGGTKLQEFQKGETNAVHAVRSSEDENQDYDSTSSFEFHKDERSMHHSVARPFSRPMPSKWSDAEKWIINKRNVQYFHTQKVDLQSQAYRASAMNMVKVAPESSGYENKLSIKRVDSCQPPSHLGTDKFVFVPNDQSCPIAIQGNSASALLDVYAGNRNSAEANNGSLSHTKSSTEETTGTSNVREVSMRDMGTEMTPVQSQEPSRSTTPVQSTSPLRSPTSSIPSTPCREEPAPTPIDLSTENSCQHSRGNGKIELSEQELKLETRREIVALGIQLGKTNIATWASMEKKESSTLEAAELERIEFAKRAAAWEEAENTKHTARFKRDEIKVQAWESEKKAKLEAEMRRIEAQVEQMKAQAQARIAKKIAMARQRSEEKRAKAEARKNQNAEKTTAQAEYIRQTGRLPTSSFVCCGWT